jgi:hypothetical protein
MALTLEPLMPDIDPNSAHDVMNATNQDGALMRELRELQRKVAAFEAAQGTNVLHAPFTGEVPRYRLNEPVFFDDTLIPAETFDQATKTWRPTEIEFTDAPNLSMVPVNEPAKRAMADYVEMLTDCQRRKAEGMGRVFQGLVTDRGVMIAQDMQDARAEARAPSVRMPEDKGFVPSMPHTDEARALQKRKPGRPRKVAVVAPTAAGRVQPPDTTGGRGYVGPNHEPPIFRETG